MSIVASFMVPHPPLIVDEIGKDEVRKIESTKNSYLKIAEEIEKLNPDTIIISSPHAPLYGDGFYLSSGKHTSGSFIDFGCKEVSFNEDIDFELVNMIEDLASKNGLLTTSKRKELLDHGSMVPLYFIRKKKINCKFVIIGYSFLPLIDNYKMGMIIKNAVNSLNRKVVYIASGDLSHKLKDYGPYGFTPEGPIYDKRIVDVMSNAKFNELLEFDEDFLDKASECGHRSFTMMAGVFDKIKVKPSYYSYQDITGVGYCICSFYPDGVKESIYDIYLMNEEKKVISNDIYVNLAKKTIENYILKKEIDNSLKTSSKSFTDRKRGVFVSIHKFNRLRGCMGTFMPTKNTVGEEIVDNAITAAINDPRFEPIKEDELKYLEINVDILSDLEDVKSISELDVKKYGIVVTSGFKRGLLLPDIDGVESVEEQIRVAKEKGNINENEDFKIEKFTVERHI